MTVFFDGTLGTSWTQVVVVRDSEGNIIDIFDTNFDGNAMPGAGTDVQIGDNVLSYTVTVSQQYYMNYEPDLATCYNLTVVQGQITFNTTTFVVHGNLANNAAVNISQNAVLTVEGDIVNNWLIANSSGYLRLDGGTVNLTGSGNLQLGSSAGTAYLTGTNTDIATFLNNESRISGAGQIGYDGQLYSPGNAIVINNTGIIDANVSGQMLLIDQSGEPTGLQAALVNTGDLVANGGGILGIWGEIIEQTSGSTLEKGTIGAYGGGVVRLGSVIVRGGYLDTSGGGAIETGLGGYATYYETEFDGSSLTHGAVTLTLGSTLRLASQLSAVLRGAIVNYGDIEVSGYQTRLSIGQGGVTLTGGGEINLSFNGDAIGYYGSSLSGENSTTTALLTNVDNLIHGAGVIGGNGPNSFWYRKIAIDNQMDGVISADMTGQSLTIAGVESFDNAGIVRAENGGKLVLTTGWNGASAIEMHVNNQGGTVLATGADSIVELVGNGNTESSIKGGTVSGLLGGEVHLTGPNAVLDGGSGEGALTINGTVRLMNAGTFRGDIINTGNIAFSQTSGGYLYVDSAGLTLSGIGSIVLDSEQYSRLNIITGNSQDGNAPSVFNNNSMIQGDGIIGRSATGGTGHLQLNNGGVIQANNAGETLLIDTGRVVTNTGILMANHGTLEIRDRVTGNGTVEVTDGGILAVTTNFDADITFTGSNTELVRFNVLGVPNAQGTYDLGMATDLTISGFGVGDRVYLADIYAYLGSHSGANSFYAPNWVQQGSTLVLTLKELVWDGEANVFVDHVYRFANTYKSHLQFTDASDISYGEVYITRMAATEGGSAGDSFEGTAGNDRILGFGGNDVFTATAGDDVLDGMDGTDTLDFAGATEGVTANLDDNGDGTVSYGSSNIVFRSMETLLGSLHGDTFNGNNTHAERFEGRDGNDTLYGGAGDTLIGGDGDDTYAVSDLSVSLEEADTAQSGTDTVLVWGNIASFTLGANFENLTNQYGAASFTGTGNALNNVMTGSDSAADTLYGLDGDDTLKGEANTYGSSDDNLFGGAGEDDLDGGAGSDDLYGEADADTLRGGTGHDRYFLTDLLDTVIESETGLESYQGGIDHVYLNVASGTYTLTANVERLTLQGTGALNGNGNALDNFLYGNDAANTLDGKAGADRMDGKGGNDIYYVDHANDLIVEAAGGGTDTIRASVHYVLRTGVEVERIETTNAALTTALYLTGNSLVQTIVGNNGANVIDGVGGADTLEGKAGNDTYYVDNASARVLETSTGGTLDRVLTSVSYALGTGQYIERLETQSVAGTTSINLTGNAVAQTIIGNNGINFINGLGGADTMIGNGGNDTYVVDNAGDQVIENNLGGTDKVLTTLSYSLGAGQYIERLEAADATSTAAFVLKGNEFGQTIIGNAGANTIHGGFGNDILTGGAGIDKFVFDHALSALNNVDTITDMTSVDKIVLDNDIFTALGTSLTVDEFRAITTTTSFASVDATDRIIYLKATGQLFYDADGSGAAPRILFAKFAPGASLSFSQLGLIE